MPANQAGNTPSPQAPGTLRPPSPPSWSNLDGVSGASPGHTAAGGRPRCVNCIERMLSGLAVTTEVAVLQVTLNLSRSLLTVVFEAASQDSGTQTIARCLRPARRLLQRTETSPGSGEALGWVHGWWVGFGGWGHMGGNRGRGPRLCV